MGYSAQMAIPLLLFVIFSIPRATMSQASARTMERVMGTYMDVVARTGVFTPGQLADMGTIKDTFVSSLAQMEASGKTSKGMLNAMNMGFASSVAEIAIAEQGGADLSQKTNAIANALSQAFLQVTGTVPRAFINEIRNLITMFAQVSSNDISGSASAVASAGAVAGGQQGQQQSQQIITTSVTSQSGTSSAQAYGSGAGKFFIIILTFLVQLSQPVNF